MKYLKVRFTSKDRGNTAGLVIDNERLAKMTVGEISQMFPYSESMKMERLEVSPEFDTDFDAILHVF